MVSRSTVSSIPKRNKFYNFTLENSDKIKLLFMDNLPKTSPVSVIFMIKKIYSDLYFYQFSLCQSFVSVPAAANDVKHTIITITR